MALPKGVTIKKILFVAFVVLPATRAGAQIQDPSAVTAEVRLGQSLALVGQPLWADFILHNPTDQVCILRPGPAEATESTLSPLTALPLGHVLGKGWLVVKDADGRALAASIQQDSVDDQSTIRLGPQGLLGLRIDMRKFFPTLQRPGTYTITWQPYEAATTAAPVVVRVEAIQQARIETDFGPLSVQFFYDDAPQHVLNFIQLAQQGFYDNLTFHRLVPGYLIQGGSPGGNPSGIRPDGRLLDPEFNDHKFVRGTVGMARRASDPTSASCQFFISYTRWPELDGQYTVFGQLVGEVSFQTLGKLMSMQVDANNSPLKTLYIRTIRIESADADSADSPVANR